MRTAADDSTLATTLSGPVRGERTAHGAVFRGIPYARAPRFGAAEAVEPWAELRDCTRFGPDCPQPRAGRLGGLLAAFAGEQRQSEDCLVLNVWTPAADGARRPTLVWLHGGGFLIGSGAVPMYDGDAFARDGCVLVTLNYRLHALGSLYLDELFAGAEGTGNLAVLDQIAALEWVRDNIAGFGGDPEDVTVFGESAGAGYVGTLLGTPAADGLYRRAVLQSGAAHHDLPTATAQRIAVRTLQLLGVQPGDWPALRRVATGRVVRAAARIFGREVRTLLGEDAHLKVPFLPVLDGTVRTQRSIDRIRSGAVQDVEILIGTCADEYRAFVWGLPPLLRRFLPSIEAAAYLPADTVEDLVGTYRAGRPDAGQRGVEAAIDGDQMFRIPAIRLAEAQAAAGGRVWMYEFAWPTPVRGGRLGACHALDVPFVFDNLDHARALCGPAAPQGLADAVHSAWVRFAATGDPGGGDLPPWATYDPDSRPVMELGMRARVKLDPRRRERLAWEGLW